MGRTAPQLGQRGKSHRKEGKKSSSVGEKQRKKGVFFPFVEQKLCRAGRSCAPGTRLAKTARGELPEGTGKVALQKTQGGKETGFWEKEDGKSLAEGTGLFRRSFRAAPRRGGIISGKKKRRGGEVYHFAVRRSHQNVF